MKKCWECGKDEKECKCGSPRPKPANTEYETKAEQDANALRNRSALERLIDKLFQ